MATKEATVVIIDVGKSMAEQHAERNETDLQWAMRYVWDRITSTVANARKTAQVGVIALRSDKTANDMKNDEGYQHISVIQPISQIFMSNLRDLRGMIKTSSTDRGDALSALAIAIQMISSHCRKLQYIRQIVLVTNGRGRMDADDLIDISSKLIEDGIKLVVVGVDFDDATFGYEEENKAEVKRKNETILRDLTEKAGGTFGTLAEAIEELETPRIKPIKPTPTYRGALTLGDTEKYDSALAINVERYPRTMVASPPSATTFIVRSGTATGEPSSQSSATVAHGDSAQSAPNPTSLVTTKMARTYHIIDESAPSGKREVNREELAKGYTYGRKAVPISESEENVTAFETTSGLDIIGFIPAENHHRFTDMSRTSVIIPQRTDEKAYMALSSLIHALWETDSFAIARLVAKDNRPPVTLLLAPSIEPDFECLIDFELPFAEDVRSYTFPPLDRIVTVSGKVLTQHRKLPSETLVKAMDAYVDQMELSTLAHDDAGNPAEYLPMEEAYSPVLHRLQQAIRWRAVRPMEAVPPPPTALTRSSHLPEELLESVKPCLDAVQKAGDVKKVPPRQLSRKRTRDPITPLSGLNVSALLHADPSRHRNTTAPLSPTNAIPEFKQRLATAAAPGIIEDAARQLTRLAEAWIRNSVGDSGYGRALEALRVLREELDELEVPAIWNGVVRELKRKLLAGELGGDRAEMWWLMRVNRLGLIDRRGSPTSDVTEDEAKQFLMAR
ncbi:MAG: ATP-dependent DNA helicase II subunit 2 [Bathelium mastoideum]|nr:MAG: ATP-dependent DNA helicase II subunit 2 [Bathelium mastoideum]